MLEVEGGSGPSCMRILRHEAGHAIVGRCDEVVADAVSAGLA